MPRKKALKRKPARKAKGKSGLDRQMDHFGEEVGALGERFGKGMEQKGREWDSWYCRTFGPVGPVVSAVFGLFILSLAVWLLSVVNLPIGSGFLDNVGNFLFDNLGLFFVIFLFFSYTSYLSRVFPKGYRPLSPIVTALGVVVALWVAAQAVIIANVSLGIAVLTGMTSLVLINIAWIFGLLLVLGYVIFSIKLALEGPGERREKIMPAAKPVHASRPVKGGPKRLYRSGREKILGGVCGGIAEYLGVDPVIIRLLWVIGTFAWGFGILAYIIAWIIMPRNPNHKWED